MIPDESIDAALGKMAAAPIVRELMRAALEAAAPHLMAGLRADLVKLAKDFDTAEGGTLAYLSQNGLRKNAHDQILYVMDDHGMLNTAQQ